MTKEQITSEKFMQLLMDKLDRVVDEVKQTNVDITGFETAAKYGYLKGLLMSASWQMPTDLGVAMGLIKVQYNVVFFKNEDDTIGEVIFTGDLLGRAEMYLEDFQQNLKKGETLKITSKIIELP